MNPGARHWQTLRDHPSAVLLAGQLLVVLAHPFLEPYPLGHAAIGVGQMLLVSVAVWAVRSTPALSRVAVLFGVPAMGFAVAEAVQPDVGWVVLVSAALHVPFYFFVSYALIRYCFDDNVVTRDELYATGAAFTVVAWGFAYVYAAAQIVWPGSFGEEREWFELLFLSFTTLTSVGLSDIVPVTAHSRSLMMVEEVAGVFYIALVVARLIALARPVVRG